MADTATEQTTVERKTADIVKRVLKSCSVVDDVDVEDAVAKAIREVEDYLGAPWIPTEAEEILHGDDTRRLQISGSCVRCVNSVHMSDEGKRGPWHSVTYHEDHVGGLHIGPAGLGLDCCCGGVWPKGCLVRVRYEHGVDPKWCDSIADIVEVVAERIVKKCDNFKSRTMGSYSETRFPEVYEFGHITEAECKRLAKCHC